MTETICKQCTHLHSEAKRDHWVRWLCSAFPIEVHTNYVTGESTEPYALCRSINKDGNCEMYERGHNIFNMKDEEK